MAMHEAEHSAGTAYAYAVLDRDGAAEFGCVHLRPLAEFLERTGTRLRTTATDPDHAMIVTFWLIDSRELRPSTLKSSCAHGDGYRSCPTCGSSTSTNPKVWVGFGVFGALTTKRHPADHPEWDRGHVAMVRTTASTPRHPVALPSGHRGQHRRRCAPWASEPPAAGSASHR